MKTNTTANELTNRRAFLSRAATVAACAMVSPRLLAAETPAKAMDKPNSVIHGVRIGCITYSYRGGNINSAEETLKALIQDGLSEVEMMGGPIQSFAGIREAGLGAPGAG